MTTQDPEVAALANVLTAVTMTADVRNAGDNWYKTGQTYNVPPSVAYRWQGQGLCSVGTAPTIAASAINLKPRQATINLASTTYISQPSDWWVEYGRTTSYGQRVPVGPKTVGASTNDSVQINALVANTTYHWRVVAVGAGGRVNQADQTFSTPDYASKP